MGKKRERTPASTGKQSESADGASEEQKGGFPIVGVGASAGGLESLQRLLEAMPDQPNVAMVIVQHLAQNLPSHAAELLAKYTSMTLHRAGDSMIVEPNCVYFIPPGQYLEIEGGRLRLQSMQARSTVPVVVDRFFRALAKDQHRCAVGVILSGTGSDGTLGIKAIKEAGGFVIAQDPNTSEYEGMATSAIETGMVDQVLSPAEIAAAITHFAKHPYLKSSRSPSRAAVSPSDQEDLGGFSEGISKQTLETIVSLLRKHSRYDFRDYKEGTLLRRIRRRMCLQQIVRVSQYLNYLENHPEELSALSKDLLISVTDFFRDANVWKELAEQVIPSIVASKFAEHEVVDGNANLSQIRVWIPGCATGEEPYTVAMLFLDELSKQQKECRLQVFASDVDKDALAYARAGRYPQSIQADVTRARIQRYFVAEADGDHYRVNKTLRDVVLFAEQNLIADPPFSQLDLICCRNVLIYLKPETQHKVMGIFYYALQRQGYLLLGTAETIGRQDELFSTVDKRWRIFQRANSAPHVRIDFPIPSGQTQQPYRTPLPLPLRRHDKQIAQMIKKRLFDIVAPCAVLIDRHWQILYINGDVNRFLQFGAGVPNDDLLSKLRSDLKLKLRDAVRKTFAEKKPVQFNYRLDHDHRPRDVTIEIRLLDDAENEDAFVLIAFKSFEDQAVAEPQIDSPSGDCEGDLGEGDLGEGDLGEGDLGEGKLGEDVGSDSTLDERDSIIRHLENELRLVKDEFQSSLEHFEIAHEEYKASNEEVLSVNEELQSTNEELETSKEELQSLNEELATVNQELASKIDELERKHADLENLVSATQIPTICLDNHLAIRWFTPAVESLIRVRQSDQGRSICDLAHDFLDGDLAAECAQVIDKKLPVENEVCCHDGRVFVRRVLPYRSDDKVGGGVVVTMIDISERKKREEELRANEAQLRHALQVDGIGVLFFDAKGGLLNCNDWFLDRTGFTRNEVQSHSLQQLNLDPPPEWYHVASEKYDELDQTGYIVPYERDFRCKNGAVLRMLFSGYSRDDGTIVAQCIDIGERKRMEAKLSATEQKLRLASKAANLGWYSYDVANQKLSWSNELRNIAQITPDEPINCDRITKMVHPDDRERYLVHLSDALRRCDDNGYRAEFRVVSTQDEIRWIEDRGKVIYSLEQGKRMAQFSVGMWVDITERKTAEESVQELNRILGEQVLQRTEFLDILQNITRVANESKTVEDAMRATLQRIASYNGWMVGHLWRCCSDDCEQMESSGLWHVRVDAKEQFLRFDEFRQYRSRMRFHAGEGMIGTVLQTGQPIWVEDTSLNPMFHTLSDFGFHAACAFPITVDGETVAIMEFISDQVQSRRDRFFEILPDIGIQLGHLIARKRLEEVVTEVAVIEQQRIGRELHDGIAQQLTGGALIAESLRRSMPPEMQSQLENVKHLGDILKQTHQDVRRLSDGLLKNSIDSVELFAALEGLCRETTRRFDVPCDLDAERFDESYITDDAVAFVIYQIACEAVHNAIKHAQTKRICIELSTNDQFSVKIQDDGIGIAETPPKANTNGLNIMRYRAESVGGELRIDSLPGKGTSVTFVIPKRSCQS
ncbi:chemotaxis protein CheB [Novipirellula caenicola]|uniref:Protein-glutamate methylesterase/protein-glutamine glutaminase n=1 Tax=Novipirellula caenicola TaxID=1536901 RepID=A0ABP9W232_9BACT